MKVPYRPTKKRGRSRSQTRREYEANDRGRARNVGQGAEDVDGGSRESVASGDEEGDDGWRAREVGEER